MAPYLLIPKDKIYQPLTVMASLLLLLQGKIPLAQVLFFSLIVMANNA